MDKKGRLSPALISVLVLTIVIIIVIFQVLADTAPEISSAAGNVSAVYNSSDNCAPGDTHCGVTVLPLTSFFKKKGVILLALMAGIAIVVIVGVMKFGKS